MSGERGGLHERARGLLYTGESVAAEHGLFIFFVAARRRVTMKQPEDVRVSREEGEPFLSAPLYRRPSQNGG